jgi:hypothetical protein
MMLQHILNLHHLKQSAVNVGETALMADVLGTVLGIFLCLFLFSPALLIIYMLIHSRIDIDKDGKGDTPIIWK